MTLIFDRELLRFGEEEARTVGVCSAWLDDSHTTSVRSLL